MKNLYTLFQSHPVISTDSRNCPEGSVFFALRGDKFDANAFAASALANGAAYAVIDNAEFAVDSRYVVVEDTLLALQDLAKTHRKELGTTIIGITGTNGKTTTKELLFTVLKEKYNTHYTEGNFNNHIGVPLTLLKMNKSHELAIIEMGANHPNEIALLCEIAQPNYGIVTNVGRAHLEGFGSFDGVKKTKAELYDYLQEHGAKAFIQSGNAELMEMARKSGVNLETEVLKYTLDEKLNDRIAVGEVVNNSLFLEMTCQTNAGEFNLKTELVGAYNAENVMCAVAVANYFGLSNQEIKEALEAYQPSNNRSQLLKTETNNLIVDAYNANPTSMQAAIANFAQLQVANKVLILGDMLELGSQSAEEHRRIIELLEASNLQEVYLVGENFAAVSTKFRTFVNADNLIALFKEHSLSNSNVLLKGSNGIGLIKLVAYL